MLKLSTNLGYKNSDKGGLLQTMGIPAEYPLFLPKKLSIYVVYYIYVSGKGKMTYHIRLYTHSAQNKGYHTYDSLTWPNGHLFLSRLSTKITTFGSMIAGTIFRNGSIMY